MQTADIIRAACKDESAYNEVMRIFQQQVEERTRDLMAFTDKLKQLHGIATQSYPDLDSLFNAYLTTGCDLLELPMGIVSRVDGQIYTVMAAKYDDESVKMGDVFDLGDTVCDLVINQRQTIIQTPTSVDIHPAMRDFDLGFYIGTPIWCEGEIYGTLNFTALDARGDLFDELEIEFIELMAHAIGQAITAHRRQLRQEVIETERRHIDRRYRALFDQNNDAVFIISLDGMIEAVNQQVLNMLGYAREEMLGSRAMEHVLPEERTRSDDRRKQLAAGKPIPVYERTFVHRSGRLIPAEVNAALVFDDDGRPLHIQSIVRDITERKSAEQALRESEERYRTIIELANEGIWMTDALNRTTFVNNKMAEMLGCDPHEIIGHPFAEFVDEAMVVPDVSGQFDLKIRGKSGDDLWVIMSTRSLNEGGMIAMLTDITERKKVEDRLRESQHFIERITRTIPDIVYVFDLNEGRNIYANRRILDLLGYGVEEIQEMGSYISQIIHPDDLSRFRQHFTRIQESKEGELFEIEYRARRSDGAWRWLSSRDTGFMRDERGAVTQLLGIAQDVTARKQAVEQVRKAKESLELVLKAANDGFWDWDMTTGEIYFSPRWKSMLGYEDHELPNTLESWQQVITEEDYLKALQLVEDYNAGLVNEFVMIQRFHHKNGSLVYVLSRAINVKNGRGQVVRMVGAHTDITAQVQAKEEAEAANRAKSVFLANMSHELRTPLNAIIGFAQLLNHEEVTLAQAREYHDLILKSGEHLLQLINDILEISKIESGRLELQPEGFDLYDLIANLEALFLVHAQDKGLALDFGHDPALAQFIYADKRKLRQILVNLIGNALKFTEQGHIGLYAWGQVRRDGRLDLFISVSDTGPGIDTDEMGALFEPFKQTQTGMNAQQGSGLGLAISWQFAQMMGGEIAVESLLGEGTTFTVHVIVDAAQAVPASPMVENIRLVPGETYRVVVADDRAVNRHILVRLMEFIGCEVREAGNGQEVLDIWRRWKPDIIWMDMRMPLVDGYEATRRIKASDNPPVVIAVTASAFEHELSHVLQAGCDDYIAKPFRETELYDKMRQHLHAHFIGETPPPPDGAREEDIVTQIRALPVAWREALAQAARDLDVTTSDALIREIRPRNSTLADHLAQRVTQFDFETIAWLVEQADTHEV